MFYMEKISNHYQSYRFIIYIQMSSYLEEYIQKLNSLPEGTNRFLRNIREIDKKVEIEQLELAQLQKDFLEKIKKTKIKKLENKAKEGFDTELQEIRKKQKSLYNMAFQKVKIAQELYALVQEPLEKLDNDLKKLYQELQKSGQLEQLEQNKSRDSFTRRKKNKYERKITQRLEQNKPVMNQLTELKYCYCSKPSAGQMVMCDNNLCVREWFHVDCIQEKSFGDKWYCLDCRKLHQKEKNRVTLRN